MVTAAVAATLRAMVFYAVATPSASTKASASVNETRRCGSCLRTICSSTFCQAEIALELWIEIANRP